MPSFGVTGNTLRDVSGNGNDGTLTATSWVVSGGSKSLSYNGLTSKTEIQHDSIFENQKMSACIWFKPDTIGTIDNYTHLFFKKKTSSPFTAFGLWLQKTGNIFGGFGAGHESTGSQVPLNKWTFAVLSYDGSHRSIFLNGSLDVEAADTFSIQYDSNPIQIGFGDYNLEFDGSVGSASIYNRALSPTEIKQLYLNPAAPFQKKTTTVVSVPVAPVTTTAKAVVLKKPKPSYATGYARNASESANPNLWKGLVGAWMPSFGVTGGTLKDVSGNGNDGTLTNMDAASDWVATSKGLALDFDGVNDYVDFGNVLNLSKITISTWFKPKSLSGRQFLIGKWENGKRSYQISLNQSGFPAGTISSAISTDGQLGTAVECNVNSVITSTSKYYHICMTANGNSLTTYVDGKQGNSVIAGSPYSSGNAYLALGTILFFSNTSPLSPANATIANATIYNRALSPTEIKQLYLNPSAPFLRKQQTVGISTAQAFNPYWGNQATQLAGTLQ